jgi:hypothetical protein
MVLCLLGKCINDCNGFGLCDRSGVCACQDGYGGVDCTPIAIADGFIFLIGSSICIGLVVFYFLVEFTCSGPPKTPDFYPPKPPIDRRISFGRSRPSISSKASSPTLNGQNRVLSQSQQAPPVREKPDNPNYLNEIEMSEVSRSNGKDDAADSSASTDYEDIPPASSNAGRSALTSTRYNDLPPDRNGNGLDRSVDYVDSSE